MCQEEEGMGLGTIQLVSATRNLSEESDSTWG